MEKKIHLNGCVGATLCGKNTATFSDIVLAQRYSEVTCKICMKTKIYIMYLEGRYEEKPETFEQDCASGYYKTGKIVPWLQKLVDEFSPAEALEIVENFNRGFPLVEDNCVTISETNLLKMITNTFALFAINKKLGNGDPLAELSPLVSTIARAKVLTEELLKVLKD